MVQFESNLTKDIGLTYTQVRIAVSKMFQYIYIEIISLQHDVDIC